MLRVASASVLRFAPENLRSFSIRWPTLHSQHCKALKLQKGVSGGPNRYILNHIDHKSNQLPPNAQRRLGYQGSSDKEETTKEHFHISSLVI